MIVSSGRITWKELTITRQTSCRNSSFLDKYGYLCAWLNFYLFQAHSLCFTSSSFRNSLKLFTSTGILYEKSLILLFVFFLSILQDHHKGFLSEDGYTVFYDHRRYSNLKNSAFLENKFSLAELVSSKGQSAQMLGYRCQLSLFGPSLSNPDFTVKSAAFMQEHKANSSCSVWAT